MKGMTAAQPRPSKYTPDNMRRMIASRMHWDDGQRVPFEALDPYKLNDSEVVVFVITNGEPLILRDDLNLFPSDAFITQLRLLGGDK